MLSRSLAQTYDFVRVTILVRTAMWRYPIIMTSYDINLQPSCCLNPQKKVEKPVTSAKCVWVKNFFLKKTSKTSYSSTLRWGVSHSYVKSYSKFDTNFCKFADKMIILAKILLKISKSVQNVEQKNRPTVQKDETRLYLFPFEVYQNLINPSRPVHFRKLY